jgi:hypothetical protein
MFGGEGQLGPLAAHVEIRITPAGTVAGAWPGRLELEFYRVRIHLPENQPWRNGKRNGAKTEPGD